MGAQWNILLTEFLFVSLHNVHLSFFHCKWMCTMAVYIRLIILKYLWYLGTICEWHNCINHI